MPPSESPDAEELPLPETDELPLSDDAVLPEGDPEDPLYWKYAALAQVDGASYGSTWSAFQPRSLKDGETLRRGCLLRRQRRRGSGRHRQQRDQQSAPNSFSHSPSLTMCNNLDLIVTKVTNSVPYFPLGFNRKKSEKCPHFPEKN